MVFVTLVVMKIRYNVIVNNSVFYFSFFFFCKTNFCKKISWLCHRVILRLYLRLHIVKIANKMRKRTSAYMQPGILCLCVVAHVSGG